MLSKALKDLAAGASLHQVWLYQAYHELTSKYKRTFLGSLWVTGSMVFTSISVAIVFGGLFGQPIEIALPYCMGGLLAASMCFYPVQEAPETLMSNSGIIRNHAYPFTYYIFEHVARLAFLFLHNAVVFYIMLACVGRLGPPHWTLLPGLCIVIVHMFLWGTVTSMLSARFRDLRYLFPYIGTLLFFLTPLYWQAKDLKGWRALIADANPFYALVQLIRAPLLGESATQHNWLVSLAVVGIGIVIWVVTFSAFRRKIPFWV